MGYQGEWLIPYRVIDAKGWGVVTMEDLDQHTAVCMELLAQAQIHAPGRLVYLIFDTTDSESYPPSYLMISRAMPVLRFKNRGMMFLITQNSAIRSILELTAHLLHFPIQVYPTRQEALQALEATMMKDDLSVFSEHR